MFRMLIKIPSTAAAVACLCVWMLSISPAAQTPDAAAHKAWMSEASDAQENYRFALEDKDQKAALEALTMLEALMGKTEGYWTAKKVSEAVKLAKDARGFAAGALASTKSGNVPAAKDSFDRMGASCNACHELHLEKR
jgi:hypothetical protein